MDTYRQERIEEIPPTLGTAIDRAFNPPDYRDAFRVETGGRYATVTDFATAYFLNQPRWLSLVSMNLASRQKLKAAIVDANDYQANTAIGSWKVYDRTEDEIVFGDNMGFMEYRFSFRLDAAGFVEASTAVKYGWGGAGRFYFAIVKPMHNGSCRSRSVPPVPLWRRWFKFFYPLADEHVVVYREGGQLFAIPITRLA